LCADVAALRASVDKLTHVTVGTGMGSEIQADLKDVQAKLTTLANNAHGQWQAQTSALQTALTSLGTAVKTLISNPSSSAVSGVRAALRGVSTAAQNLFAAASAGCPSASPTSSG
jgi:predicted PurR-regulated permease PerM